LSTILFDLFLDMLLYTICAYLLRTV